MGAWRRSGEISSSPTRARTRLGRNGSLWAWEDAGYSTRLQVWDFVVGSHFVAEMHKALQSNKTVTLLSSAYLGSSYATPEWQAAWADDPNGRSRKLLVLRLEECGRPGLLGQVVSEDLFGVDRDTAAARLLSAAEGKRRKPAAEPQFPGQATPLAASEPMFPGQPPPAFSLTPVRPVFPPNESCIGQNDTPVPSSYDSPTSPTSPTGTATPTPAPAGQSDIVAGCRVPQHRPRSVWRVAVVVTLAGLGLGMAVATAIGDSHGDAATALGAAAQG